MYMYMLSCLLWKFSFIGIVPLVLLSGGYFIWPIISIFLLWLFSFPTENFCDSLST